MNLSLNRLPALRYRDFRLVWTGELVSTIGSQMQLYAIDWHIFQLLRGQTVQAGGIVLSAEALGLGLLGLARIVPIILFALAGGMLADSYDRRKVMIATRIVAGILAGILAFITLTGQVTTGAIYFMTALASGVAAFDNPARQSLVPNLVPREHLSNAVSLNTLMWQMAMIVAPAMTGILIGLGSISLSRDALLDINRVNAHIGVIYALNALSFAAAIIALWFIRSGGKQTTSGSGIGLKPLVEGMRFTYNTRVIWGSMLLDFLATFFASARTMLPIVATTVLGLDAAGYGLLATAQAVGAFTAGSIVALRPEIYHQGRVLLISVIVYGLATMFFGLSVTFVPAYIFFALTGAGDTVSTVIRGTIRQIMTPDYLRGRMTSVNMVFFMGGPQLGELEAGVVASALGAPFAIVSGGLATVLLTLWIAWRYPRLREYTSDTSRELLEKQNNPL
jgi:MFS family permease